MKKYTKTEILTFVKNISLVVIGTIILAFGTGIFIIPFELITGGMSGIAIILKQVIPFDITIDVYIAILTWASFFLGLFVLGKNFALKTLVSTIVYPIALSLSLKLVSPDVLGGIFMIQNSNYSEIAIILASIFGGAFVGCGCAITFIGGGSTGGADVLAFIICKINKKLKSSLVIFLLDALIILCGVFVIKDIVISLLGIISSFVCALVVDRLFLGESKAFIANIVTDHYEAINQEIIKVLERTTTITDVIGGYSKQPKKLIIVSFSMNQYMEFLNIINKNDKRAFVTIHRAHEINGEGWE